MSTMTAQPSTCIYEGTEIGPLPQRLPPLPLQSTLLTQRTTEARPQRSAVPHIVIQVATPIDRFSTYSALSPIQARTDRELRISHPRIKHAHSSEALYSRANHCTPIPISTSSTNLPLAAVGQGPSQVSKSSTISRLLASVRGNTSANWRKQQRERISKIEETKMSNGTANFYYPPEEQEWDPRAVQRLARISTAARV